MVTYADLEPYLPRITNLVRRAGWTLDDVRQEAWLCLTAVTATPGFMALDSEAAQAQYAVKALSRWCVRKARGGTFHSLATGVDTIDLNNNNDESRIELNDLIASAPIYIDDYLTLRVIEQRSWDDTRDTLRMSNDSLARLRHRTADWLLAQYEGRPSEKPVCN